MERSTLEATATVPQIVIQTNSSVVIDITELSTR